MADLTTITAQIGQPSSLEQDKRAGLSAIWGSRATGAFSVERSPVTVNGSYEGKYEVILLPVETSTHQFEKHEFTADELNTWFAANVTKIQAVLAGK